MICRRRSAAPVALTALAVAAVAACAGPAMKPLVDPFPLRFPLIEAGSLEIPGRVVGQPRVQDGIYRCIDSEGYLTEVVISSQAVLSRYKAIENGGPRSLPIEGQVTAGPVLVRDADGGLKGTLAGYSDGLLVAGDDKGRPLWEFQAAGAIPADPVVAGGRVYFGDAERMFYGLSLATGKLIWKRRLQGAPLHPAVVIGRRLAVAASNSVVYILSVKGGSILSWESVPSRVVHELAPAGSAVLVSSASPMVVALDPKSGKRAGQYEAPGPLVAGAVWSPPYVVLAVEDPDTGGQRLVFLRSR
jgi:outer membrane protein assembly factor BamB